MKIIKKVTRLMLLLATCISVGCATPQGASARTLAPEEVALGGITAGAPMAYVRKVYGEPTHTDSLYDGELEENLIRWDYGSGTTILFHRTTGKVSSVTVRENNGFATPAGAYVGMNASVLQRLYGDDSQAGRPYVAFCAGLVDHRTARFYIVDDPSCIHGLWFRIDASGKISSITMSNDFYG